MRAVSVNPDALVVTSGFWQTNAVALRVGEEAVLIDSPYLPDELDALPSLLAGAGFEPDGLLATHADFDHLLGRIAFPGMTLGVCESSMERLHREPGGAQRALREYDAKFYVTRARRRSRSVRCRRCRCPGTSRSATASWSCTRPRAIRPTGWRSSTARRACWCVGDYLSDVEIPWISVGGSLVDYRATLARLAPLIEQAETLVPGHGAPHDRETTLRLLDEDVAYLDALEGGDEQQPLPKGRDSKAQREIHAENLTRV